ncbi:MAG TPA: HlyD family efflux transporter periplasmic adaptor subunit [Lacipirellulaceae bacterium]|nr:HlyD family efflux transporter periplasmic adaptor subunit [Lacipirellulaceae bacterium]
MFSKFINLLVKIGLPILAIALIAFSVKYLAQAKERLPKLPPPVTPAENPFPNTVAGAGIVEPETENISIGTSLPGIVVEVMVKVGQHVKAGDPLFRIDDRDRKAELEVRQAMLADAKSSLERLKAMPRPEELPAAEAKVKEAKADWDNWEQQWARGEKLVTDRAISQEEFLDRKESAIQARERYNRATADLNLLKAGTWKPDLQVAQAAVEHAQAQVDQAQTDIDRLTVRALVDGEVLQVNVRPGEYVGAPPDKALIVLGNVTQLHVRVDIDEYDIPRFVPHAPARATLKGQPTKDFFPLKFVRIEPYVVPKKSLTGDNTERVDTRVLQVIYAIDTTGKRLFVGQQVDVFIDASSSVPVRTTFDSL